MAFNFPTWKINGLMDYNFPPIKEDWHFRDSKLPILDIMDDYILDWVTYSKMVSELFKKNRDIDLRDYNISGVKLIDDFHILKLELRGDIHNFYTG